MPKRLSVYTEARQWPGRYLVLYGGAGSGKSREVANIFVDKCLTARDEPRRVLATRKVGRTVRGSVYQQFLDVLKDVGWLAHVRQNKTVGEIFFPNGSTIICSGLDDPEKIKSISGITDIWMEEASEYSYEDFVQLDLRLRGEQAKSGTFALTFNPISRELWIKDHFVDTTRDGAFVQKTTYLDNPLVGPEYRSVLDSITDPLMRQIYLEGEWGDNVKGLIFKDWETIQEMPEKGVRAFGLDFGYNDPMALMEVRVYDQSDLFVNEWLYETHLTTSDLIAEMKNLGVPKDATIIADSAEPDRIEEIFRAGFRGIKPANKGQGSVNAGISKVQSLKMHVTESSVNFKRELRTYKWQENKTGDLLDKPIDMDNHGCDAVRYPVDVLVRPKTFSGKGARLTI